MLVNLDIINIACVDVQLALNSSPVRGRARGGARGGVCGGACGGCTEEDEALDRQLKV